MSHDLQCLTDGWELFSEWIDSVRDESRLIRRYDNDERFKKQLMNCRTNYERFKLIWENNELRKEMRTFAQRDSDETKGFKSAEDSRAFREEGNQSFREHNFQDALRCYTNAIRTAPYDNDETLSLALALANRSAALYSMRRYRACLNDIELAVRFKYPEANMFKLYIRKVRCLHALSIWSNDIEDLKTKLQSMLRESEVSDPVKNEIRLMFEFIETTNPQTIEKDSNDAEDEPVRKLCNPSKFVHQATDCVEMSYSAERGRCLLNNNVVYFGRALVAEAPFVSNLAFACRDYYCYNCFVKLNDCGLGCKVCREVLYCSLKCVEANSQLHAYECRGFLNYQFEIGVAYIVAHIMFKMNFNFKGLAVSNKKKSFEKTVDEVIAIEQTDWPDLIYKCDYPALLSLQDHASDYDYDSMMGYALTAVYLMTAFVDYFPSKFPDEEYCLYVGSLTLRHLLQLQTNLVSILDQDLSAMTLIGHNISGVRERPIGVGIYPTVALLNHSCSPNTLSIFHKNKFFVRANKTFDVGTEIEYCYGPNVNSMSKPDRKKRLKEQYFFDCQCHACVNDIENEARALICDVCQGPVIYNKDFTHRCLKCGAIDRLETADIMREISRLKEKFEQLCEVPDEEMHNSIGEIQNVESRLRELVFWKNPIFIDIKSRLVQCALAEGEFNEAIRYSKDELELSDKTNGENSIESIMTMLKSLNINKSHCEHQFETNGPDQALKDDLQGLLTTVQRTRGKLKELLNSTSILEAEESFEPEFKFLSETQARLNELIDMHTSDTATTEGVESDTSSSAKVEKRPDESNTESQAETVSESKSEAEADAGDDNSSSITEAK